MNKIDKLAQAVEAMADTTLPDPDLSFGCDILDLAISGHPGSAMGPGRFLWAHGNSGTGKSYYTKILLAEAARNPSYDNHRIVVFDGENGSNFPTEKFFGRKLAERLIYARAESLDHLYDAMDSLAQEPVLMLVDSWDSWLPASTIKHIGESAKARADEKEPDGSYGMEQGKIHSNRLRLLVPRLKETGSLLLGISQHRDNVSRANKYSPADVTAGGRALRFWCHVELETRLKGKLERTVNGDTVQIGDIVSVRVHKNRMNGMKSPVDLEFYPSFGVCNIGSSLRWLVDNKYLSCAGGRYKLPFMGDKAYYKEDVIARIEEANKEPEMTRFLLDSFNNWTGQLTVQRKSKYDK